MTLPLRHWLPVALALLPLRASALAVPAYRDPRLSTEARIDDLLGRMTLDEKIGLVHASGTFRSGGVPRLGVPPLWTDDGPQGVRDEVATVGWGATGRTDDFATAMPPGATVAATWNPALAEACARAIGEEARARGKHVMLAPGINIARTPLCGRNYDYYGEDPWLTSRLAVGYIRGLQAEQTAACVKHFALNNQEEARGTIDVEVDERALREIYLPGFEASVREAGVGSVMAAYNRFRGAYCAENTYLLDQVLKKEWGFTGAVISDWGAVHDTDGAARAGLDLEMGTRGPFNGFFLAQRYQDGVAAGRFPAGGLDDKARRTLRLLLASGALDGRRPGALNTQAHLDVARRVAEEGIVLLKNADHLLPLDATRLRTVAVIGENAVRTFAAGGNSAGVKAFRETTALAGLLARAGPAVNVIYSAGYRQPLVHRTGARDSAGVRRTELVEMSAAEGVALSDRAVLAAGQADVVVFVGGLIHQSHFDDEGTDRRDLSLPSRQADLIARLAAANPRLVVVLIDGGPVEMQGWLAQVPAVVQAWYGGSQAGEALAGILFGDANPSGKLPITFPRQLADTPTAHGGTRAYPGENGVVHYDEGLLVGYRWYDTRLLEPLFPFGFGLSYTSFAFGALTILAQGPDAVRVECSVTNTGTRAGAEVVQLYVRPRHPQVMRPFQELKAFAKVMLAAGETKTVALDLGARAFATYSEAEHAWKIDGTPVDLVVGTSSRDPRRQGAFTPAAATL